MGGQKTIAFDHIASYLVKEQRALAVVLLFGLIIYGTLRPFITGQWRATWTNRILSTFKVFGLIIALLMMGVMMQPIMRPIWRTPFMVAAITA